jgi:hypothetical protein
MKRYEIDAKHLMTDSGEVAMLDMIMTFDLVKIGNKVEMDIPDIGRRTL